MGHFFLSHPMENLHGSVPWDSDETSNMEYIVSCACIKSTLCRTVAKLPQIPKWVGQWKLGDHFYSCHQKMGPTTLFSGSHITTQWFWTSTSNTVNSHLSTHQFNFASRISRDRLQVVWMREEHNSVLSTPTEADKIGHFVWYRCIGETQISAWYIGLAAISVYLCK